MTRIAPLFTLILASGVSAALWAAIIFAISHWP